jgi:hypothetical protein
MKKIYVILLVAAIGVVHASEEGGMVPNAKRLAGVWVGVGDSGVPLYRLQLDSDGTGFLAFAETRMPVSVLRIKQWNLNGTNLTFAVSVLVPRPESTNSVSISVTGNWHSVYVSDIIALERRASGHTDRAVLRKDDDLGWLAQDAKRATDAARTDSASKP